MKCLVVQRDFLVGDIGGNSEKIVAIVKSSEAASVDLVVFPELCLSGYLPEDLLLRPSLASRVSTALEGVKLATHNVTAVVGYPLVDGVNCFNALGVFSNGQLIAEYKKQQLPNYQVFDEQRYFTAGGQPLVVEVAGVSVGLLICEDVWHAPTVEATVLAGAEILAVINASPFDQGKRALRADMLSERAKENQVPIVYVNTVGGQDELVFDGGSMAVSMSGEIAFQAPQFVEGDYGFTYRKESGFLVDDSRVMGSTELGLSAEAELYQALVLGVKDYVNKNGFPGVLLGLSGGIDSALTLAIAVDALGAERVEAVMMPFRYTSDMSLEDAEKQAANLNVTYQSISIEPMYEAFMSQLAPSFVGLGEDTTEQNLQARCRGVLLMALSNKSGKMVLTTGNKSEMAVGYATLYGDMAGGFAAIKDVYKTAVYRLADHYNEAQGSEVIPRRVIIRPPSAELAPGQEDTDSLPPYDQLDEMLRLYIEQDSSAADIVASGFEKNVVNKVLRLVDLNEYKRQQAAPGVRVTLRGFGKDRRYPITNKWPLF